MTHQQIFLSIILLLCGIVYGQKSRIHRPDTLETVVLADSRFYLNRKNSGRIVTKITAKQLAQDQSQTLPEILNRVAGIEINGSSSAPGQNLGFYSRGGRDHQWIIRINGITIYDPALVSGGGFDLRLLPISQIQEIEILKGAASTLYGSGASTAVIDIRTKKPTDKMLSGGASWNFGTNHSQEKQRSTLQESTTTLHLNGSIDKLEYYTAFSMREVAGLSAAEPLENAPTNSEFEEDPFSKKNWSLTFGYQINNNTKLGFFTEFNAFRTEFDNAAGVDGTNSAYSKQRRIGANFTFSYPNGELFFTNNLALIDRYSRSAFSTRFRSNVYAFELYNKYILFEKLHTITGIQGTNQGFSSYTALGFEQDFSQQISRTTANFDLVDPFFNLVFVSGTGWQCNLGARLNVHSSYKTHLVYSVNPSYTMIWDKAYFKTFGSYATAYITPSLFQLFNPNFGGNPELKPEENSTLEVGFEYVLENKIQLSTVLYSRSSYRSIRYLSQPTRFRYQNVAERFLVQGIEVNFEIELLRNMLVWDGNFAYTKLDARLSSIRIPGFKANSSIRYTPSPKTNIVLHTQFVDTRTDLFFDQNIASSSTVSLAPYALFDISLRQQLLEKLHVTASVRNIFNENYQELFGYSTTGRKVNLGMQYAF